MKHDSSFVGFRPLSLCAATFMVVTQSVLCAQSPQEILEQALLRPPPEAPVFGGSVAIDGDTAVVGANDRSDRLGSGLAYVFIRNGTEWHLQARLRASNPDADDTFGGSVAISGDTIVIGAHLEDSSATGVNGDENNNDASNSGAAYIFVRTGTNWTQQAYLKASNTGVDDFFGARVDAFGDTVVVGAQWESSSATGINGNQSNDNAAQSGAVYVFIRNGTSWSQQAYLKASNTAAGDWFGGSLGLYEDTVVIGAKFQGGTGAAYVFVRNGANWSQQAHLKASNAGADWFGSFVGIHQDTVVIGAIFEDSGATGVNGNQADNSAPDSGAAYVFVRNGTSWSQQAYLKASNPGSNDSFGDAEVFGDTIVVGSAWEASSARGVNGDQSDNSAPYAGAAYMFVRDGTSWSQQAYLKASDTSQNSFFGRSPRLSGDTLMVSGGNAVYVFSGVGVRPCNDCPPRFRLQPANQLVLPGTNVTLAAFAASTSPVLYQWHFEGAAIPGATNATYSFNNVSLTNGHGNFSVAASNEFGTTTSTNAFVFVRIRPGIVTQPISGTVLEGGSATFTCVATGAPPIYYRWSGIGISPYTNTTGVFVFSNALASITNGLRCFALNAAGNQVSATVSLWVIPDFDRDGMADSWEANYGFNPNNAADALLDLDGDGMVNRDEYASGTSPADGGDLLKLTILPADGITLRFAAQSNIAYAVEYQTDLTAAPWQTLSDVSATNLARTVEIIDPDGLAVREKFYRVRTRVRP